MNINNRYMNMGMGGIPSRQPVAPGRIIPGGNTPANGSSSNVPGKFEEILQESIEKAKDTRTDKPRYEDGLINKAEDSREVKFSKHALMRLQNRRIDLNQEQIRKISDAVDKAEVKGVKDSLVLMDKLAMVVNVKSRTVITAVNSDEMKDNVFTNIDGAVIV